MFRRFLFFGMVNIAMIIMISTILSLLGVQPYLTANGIDYQNLMIFCLVWGMAGSFISLMISKFMAKKAMGVQLIDAHDPNYGWIVRTTHEYSKRAGIEKMPEVGVYHSPDLNAFATGPSKNNSLVAVSTGLVQQMSRDEVEGVLAHEVSHIANGDMVTMTLIQGVVNAFVMFLARIASFAIAQAMRSDDDDAPVSGWAHFGLTIVFEMIFGFLALFVTSWFSRFREYRADSGGAKLAGREKMVAALQALQRNYEQMTQTKTEMPAMQISSKTSILKLISTHPPLEKRISALQSRGY